MLERSRFRNINWLASQNTKKTFKISNFYSEMTQIEIQRTQTDMTQNEWNQLKLPAEMLKYQNQFVFYLQNAQKLTKKSLLVGL